jgi:hypothetical protein
MNDAVNFCDVFFGKFQNFRSKFIEMKHYLNYQKKQAIKIFFIPINGDIRRPVRFFY